jgi:acetyl-CoA carboxylase carboxyltransferase component
VDDLDPTGWDATLADLARRKGEARAMGGRERLARRGPDRLDARARVEALLDPGTFTELGTLVGRVPADAIVAGSGRIDGRPVLVGAEDFTVLGGTIGPGSNAKRYRLAELAVRDRVPLVMLLEGAGYRQDGGEHGRSPTDLIVQARCSGRVPVVVAVMGPSAGHGALVAPLADYSLMTEAACVFTAGPPVVRASTGEDVSKEDLGGPAVALASGVVHDVVPDDRAALAAVRRYLGYFPSSAWSYPPRVERGDVDPRPVPELLDLVPRDGRRVYDMRAVIAALVDDGEAFEVQAGFGRSVLCVLARLGGEAVAIVANQPRVRAGAIDADGADKAARFITVADSYHLPLVFLADNPGVLPGSGSERAGVLRSGARMFAAQTGATVPKLHLTLRKAYGFGSMVMAMVGFDGQSATFAYPGATLGAMGTAAAVEATGADTELATRLGDAELAAGYRAAAGLGFDEIIDPRDTRTVLLGALERALGRRQEPAAPVARVGILP